MTKPTSPKTVATNDDAAYEPTAEDLAEMAAAFGGDLGEDDVTRMAAEAGEG